MQREVDGTLVHICGKIESVLFKSDDNSFCICDIEDDDENFFTATGNVPFAEVGERVELYGKWSFHKVHGRQFCVERCEKILPTTKNDILRYLSSGAIKGIGPKIAQKIVEKYGDDTFDVIANHYSWLAEIKGISLTKAREMSEDFNEKSGIREIILFCCDKFTTSTAMKIYEQFGSNGIETIKRNPYILCEKGYGVSFKCADEVAMLHGISKDAPNRIKGAIGYALHVFASRDGHTYALKERVVQAVSRLIDVPEEKIVPFIDEMAMEDKIKVVYFRNECHVYIRDNYEAEEYIAKKLLTLKKTAFAVDYKNTLAFIEQAQMQNGIEYAKMQKKAIEETLMNGVTVITGGPGTGKTTIVKALIRIFEQMGLKCALCAPTGRASQRMSETTSHMAQTVHKLLDPMFNDEIRREIVFFRNEKNLLSEDVIIVDESSMLDIHIAESLLRAIKPGSRLVMIGDVHQLPSVGEGDVLNDVISSGCFPVVELNEIFRQSETSGIVMNAHLINNGIVPDLSKKYDDFFFIEIKNEQMIPDYISSLCSTRLPKTYGIDGIRDIQVITPTKKGPNGTRSLNLSLQAALNPQTGNKGERIANLSRLYREGDKIMQTRNDYEYEWRRGEETGKGIFNGDLGIVKSVDNDGRTFTVEYDGKCVDYLMSGYDDIEHAYAITVHKSQGSEYPFVIIPLTSIAPMLLTRNLIYTAITRATRMVVLVGDKKVFAQMVENDTRIIRNTGLCQFLRSNCDESF